MIRVAASHLAGNALLLLLGYYWLGLADSSGALLLWSALVILAGFIAALWLHGFALAFFRGARFSVGRLVPLLCLAFVAVVCYVGCSFLRDAFSHEAFVIGSYATMKTRRPVAPSNILTAWQWFVSLLEWLVLPALLFPLAADLAERGWKGFALSRPRVLYWLQVAAIMFAGIYLPLRLVSWIPNLASFSTQFLSFFARFAIAYLVFTAALLLLEYITSAGNPRSAQESTVASP